EDLVTGGVGVEGIEVLLAPYAVPLLLQALEGGAVGDGGIRARCGIGHGGHSSRSAPACNAGVDSVSALARRSRPGPCAARPSRHPGSPLLGAELRLHQLTGPGELGLGVRRVDRVVAGAEVLEEAVDDLL